MPDLSRFASFGRGVCVAPVAPAAASGATEGDSHITKQFQYYSRFVAPVAPVAPRNDDAWSDEDWRAAFDERAGILEYDEGMPRAEAEQLARQQVAEMRTRQRHAHE